MRWKKISIVGVGLLGGSLGLAARQHGLVRSGGIAGYVRRPTSVRDCQRAGAVDYATTDLLAAVWGADLVVLCTPLAQMRTLVRQMLPALHRGAIVTDVGSVKGSVVKELEPIVIRAGAHFVGSHPMAGAEKNGVLAAHADLFENAVCVVTPTRKTNKAAAKKVESLWRSVGARVQRFSPERHDQLVSRSSHLPHMVAALLASRILDPEHAEQASLCATGFRDVTRIASGSPEMWRDIAMANRRNLARGLAEFISDAKKLQRAIGRADAKSIAHLLEVAKQRRDKWCACLASPSPE